MGKFDKPIHAVGTHGLANGSYVIEKRGAFHQYMNGDYMGTIKSVPKTHVESYTIKEANKLLPDCCRQRPQ